MLLYVTQSYIICCILLHSVLKGVRNMETVTIGNRIRELRKERRMTQDDLAGMMNVSRVQVNQWESGARDISAVRIIRLSEIFDTSCDYLMRGIVSQQPPLSDTPSPAQQQERTSHMPPDIGLSDETIAVLQDVSRLKSRKCKQYLTILNELLCADSFWRILMPAAAAAYTVKERDSMGGTSDQPNVPLPEEMESQIKSSVEILKLGNSAGYMDNLLISNEMAYHFQISEAVRAFRKLLKAVIEKNAHPLDAVTLHWTKPYQQNDAESSNTAEFKKFLAAFGQEPISNKD